MADNLEQIHVHIGDTVRSADDHTIGVVKAVDAEHMTVEHGTLRKSTHLIPISTVNSQSGGSLYLNVTREEIERQGW